MIPLQKVQFDFERTDATTDALITPDDVHTVFADLIKVAKSRLTSRLKVDVSENDTREKVGGTVLNPEKANFTTIELKLSVKVQND